jgi:hypothetical protein
MLAVIGKALFVGAVVFAMVQATSSRGPQHQYNENSGANHSQHKPDDVIVDGGAEEAIAYYTLWLAIFTGALVIVSFAQIRYLIRADNNTRVAAEAAKKSADVAENSLKLANRPLIVISPLSLIDHDPHIEFGCRNSGNGTGIINKITVIISTSAPRVMTLQWYTTLVNSDINTAIEVGDTHFVERVTSPLLTDMEIAKVRKGDTTLLVTIQVLSQDILKTPYDQIFPFIFDTLHGEFVRNSRFVEQKKEDSG